MSQKPDDAGRMYLRGAMAADALAGAGLTQTIDRLRNLCGLSTQLRVDSIRLDISFARNLIALLERTRETLESQSDELATLKEQGK